MVTVQAPGGDVKVFIEANPQYKSITLYDNKMNRLDQDQRQELMKKPDLDKEKDLGKDKVKEKGLATEEQDGKKSKGKKDKVNGDDKGLVTKNRTRNSGKGMGV